jgi:hypothetical protein
MLLVNVIAKGVLLLSSRNPAVVANGCVGNESHNRFYQEGVYNELTVNLIGVCQVFKNNMTMNVRRELDYSLCLVYTIGINTTTSISILTTNDLPISKSVL